MLIKRYLVRSMNEAMVRIRYELGMDAVIVSSRKIKQRGIKNLFKPKILEVTAAVDRKAEVGESINGKVDKAQVEESTGPETRLPDQTLAQAPVPTNKGESEPAGGRLEKELQELKSLVGMLLEEKTQGDGKEDDKSEAGETREENQEKTYLDRVTDHLRTMDVDEGIVDGFLAFCKESHSDIDPGKALEYFEDIMPKRTSRQEMNENVWAFIGPTGVGKTTTIAKVAAQEMLSNQKTVGLITLDTYRIGAVEQLKTYAKILSIPLEVVFNKADLINAMDRLKDCDLILIDSTGRNSLDKDQLLETKDLLDALDNKRNILVINAGTRRSDLEAIMDSYNLIGFDSIILTKLDETKYYGNILNIGEYSDKPLCFVTTGQVVPDDIIGARDANLINYVLLGVQS
ncbi:MAG TPA: flagellar biosynthesis protein FlhF [Bacillota bacterium]|nr:flagellar biosynthesis protein FlhF [Bacillota bacterium]